MSEQDNLKYSSDLVEGAIRSCKSAGWSELLNLPAFGVTDSDLKLLSEERGVHLLKYLQLVDAEMITDVGLQHIARLRGLTALSLSCVNITHEALRYLSALPSLTSLLVYSDGVKDIGFKYIAALSSLETLGVGGFRMTGEGCKEIANLLSLSRLSLGGMCMKLRDEHSRYIGMLSGLRRLTITGSEMFGHRFADFANLKLLESLTLDGNMFLKDISALKMLLPPRGSLRELIIRGYNALKLPDSLLLQTNARQILEPLSSTIVIEPEPPKARRTEDFSAIKEGWQSIPENDRRLCLALLEIVAKSPLRMDAILKELKNPKRPYQCHFHRSRIYERMKLLIRLRFILRDVGRHSLTSDGADALRLFLGPSALAEQE